MIPPLSANTQAILLLTAPLIAGRTGTQPGLLTPGEYNRLAKVLREMRRQPSDLLGPEAGPMLEDCRKIVDRKQLEKFRFRPVFVRTGSKAGKGNEALIRKGGLPWPEPKDAAALEAAINGGAATGAPEPRQESLPLLVEESPEQRADEVLF